MDFLADNNVCGQTLLRLVARGNSVIAELKRLASAIPPIFKFETKADQQKYGEVLLDFSFFQTPGVYTKKIENSETLSACDAAIRERHVAVVGRIYAVFESVHRFAAHLNTFLRDLQEGAFLHSSTDTVFADHDGKQLMCEALFLYGVMLLLLDRLYPGPVRERLLVAHHRHAGQAARDTNVDDVCRLLRSTGLKPGAKRQPGYPEDYFRRIQFPTDYTEQVVGHLRTDDIYNQVSVYPSPDHRATAFSTQASMLYVCLYFTPHTLHSNAHHMREIVDRFFPDNWVVSYYMGTTANLVEAWEPYKAAKQALQNTLEASNVKLTAGRHGSKLLTLTAQSSQLESEGALTEAKVLGQSGPLFQLVRECNVSLRWLVLHCAALDLAGGRGIKRCTALRDTVMAEVGYSPEALFQLLLHTAGLELKLTQIYKRILHDKGRRWQELTQTAGDRLLELSDAFAEEGLSRPLARVRPNARLHQWFRTTAEQVKVLDVDDDPMPTARKIVQLVNALKQVKEYHDLSSCGGAVQAVEEAEEALQGAARLAAAEDSHMAVLATVADLSYAWTLVDEYTLVMQRSIKQEPGEVARLRAVFLKLASGLELPLLRITQARSHDALSVSAFYSGTLVTYIRKVLQIIPETMFSLLGSIVELQTDHLADLPTRLDKDKMKDFAQLPQRYKVCELCHSVGVLAEGVGEMGRTLVGVVEVRPKQLLEDGVRRELVHRVAAIMHHNLAFAPKKGSGSGELMDKLSHVSRLLNGFRSSFEYIQDYINLYALKIWHEELTRIISVNVDLECALLVPALASSVDESALLAAVPVPSFPSTDGHRTFVGRLAAELIRVTDPKTCTYAVVRGAWYDNSKQRGEVADAGLLMARLEEAVTVAGLAGLDRLLACRALTAVQNFFRDLESASSGDSGARSLLETLANRTTPHSTLVGDPQRQYAAWVARAYRFTSPAMVDCLQAIGQLQLLRLHAAHRLDASCSFQANYLHEALHALNSSLLNDMRRHESDPSLHPHPDPAPTNPLSSQLTSLLEWTGLTHPLDRVYTAPTETVTKALPHVLLMLFLSLLPKLHYVPKLGSLTSVKASDGVDGSVLCVGAATLLRQLPPPATTACLALIGQFVASTAAVAGKGASVEQGLSHDACTASALLRHLAQLLAVPQQQLQLLLPAGLVSTLP